MNDLVRRADFTSRVPVLAAAVTLVTGLMSAASSVEGDPILGPLVLLAVAGTGGALSYRGVVPATIVISAAVVVWELAGHPGALGLFLACPMVVVVLEQPSPSRARVVVALAAGATMASGLLALDRNSGTVSDLIGNLTLLAIVTSGLHTLASARTKHGPQLNPDTVISQASWIGSLSAREREVLEQMVNGASNADIAQHLHISIPTVKSHVSAVIRKSDSTNRYQAALKALAAERI